MKYVKMLKCLKPGRLSHDIVIESTVDMFEPLKAEMHVNGDDFVGWAGMVLGFVARMNVLARMRVEITETFGSRNAAGLMRMLMFAGDYTIYRSHNSGVQKNNKRTIVAYFKAKYLMRLTMIEGEFPMMEGEYCLKNVDKNLATAYVLNCERKPRNTEMKFVTYSLKTMKLTSAQTEKSNERENYFYMSASNTNMSASKIPESICQSVLDELRWAVNFEMFSLGVKPASSILLEKKDHIIRCKSDSAIGRGWALWSDKSA